MPVLSEQAIATHLHGHDVLHRADVDVAGGTVPIYISQYPEVDGGVVCITPMDGLAPERTLGGHYAIRKPGILIEVAHQSYQQARALAQVVWNRLADEPDTITVDGETANVSFVPFMSEPVLADGGGRTERQRVVFVQEWMRVDGAVGCCVLSARGGRRAERA